MRTPPLRQPLSRGILSAIALVLLALSVFVYLTVRAGYEDALEELLATRAEVAAEVAREHEPEETAAQLTALGIPAVVHAPDGTVHAAQPRTLRGGGLVPPSPGGLVEPIVSRTVEMDDGTVVEVLATRAAVVASLRRLLVVTVIGSVAALALSYGLVRLLVGRVMEPLGQVAETAERIAGGTRERLDPDRPGTELGRMAASFDEMVDALEAAVARAEAEEERTRRFLADAAHQLRTPVTGVRGAVELLLQEEDPEARDRLLVHAVRETARASRLVSSLLHVQRLDMGEGPKLAPTDLAALVADEVERARDLAPQLDIRLDPEAAPEPLLLDGREVREAIANILDNARRHAASTVTVEVRASDGAEVRIADDGPGVPEDAEELVFERFATLDGRGGSGLGLPIARGVARGHGGDVTYEDGAFVLRLPRRGSADGGAGDLLESGT